MSFCNIKFDFHFENKFNLFSKINEKTMKPNEIKIQFDGKNYLIKTQVKIYNVSSELLKMIELIDEDALNLINDGDEFKIMFPENLFFFNCIFDKLIDYCDYHSKMPTTNITIPSINSLNDYFCNWDVEFFKNLDKESLMNLTNIANFLKCTNLLNSCCAKIADNIKGLKVEEMRSFFGVENDFTLEEQEKLEKKILG